MVQHLAVLNYFREAGRHAAAGAAALKEQPQRHVHDILWAIWGLEGSVALCEEHGHFA